MPLLDMLASLDVFAHVDPFQTRFPETKYVPLRRERFSFPLAPARVPRPFFLFLMNKTGPFLRETVMPDRRVDPPLLRGRERRAVQMAGSFGAPSY